MDLVCRYLCICYHSYSQRIHLLPCRSTTDCLLCIGFQFVVTCLVMLDILSGCMWIYKYRLSFRLLTFWYCFHVMPCSRHARVVLQQAVGIALVWRVQNDTRIRRHARCHKQMQTLLSNRASSCGKIMHVLYDVLWWFLGVFCSSG